MGSSLVKKVMEKKKKNVKRKVEGQNYFKATKNLLCVLCLIFSLFVVEERESRERERERDEIICNKKGEWAANLAVCSLIYK